MLKTLSRQLTCFDGAMISTFTAMLLFAKTSFLPSYYSITQKTMRRTRESHPINSLFLSGRSSKEGGRKEEEEEQEQKIKVCERQKTARCLSSYICLRQFTNTYYLHAIIVQLYLTLYPITIP